MRRSLILTIYIHLQMNSFVYGTRVPRVASVLGSGDRLEGESAGHSAAHSGHHAALFAHALAQAPGKLAAGELLGQGLEQLKLSTTWVPEPAAMRFFRLELSTEGFSRS